MKVSDIVKGGADAIVGKIMNRAAQPVDKKIIKKLFNPTKTVSIPKQKKAG